MTFEGRCPDEKRRELNGVVAARELPLGKKQGLQSTVLSVDRERH